MYHCSHERNLLYNIASFVIDPIKPLPPQRFHITATTSTSISFSWAPPFHSGGGKVDEYELIFEEETILYNQEAGKKNRKVREYLSLLY